MRQFPRGSHALLSFCLALAAVSLGCVGAPALAPPSSTAAAPAVPVPVAAAPTPGATAALVAAAPYAGVLPEYAEKTDAVAAMYRWAAPNRAILQYFQCTCGCENGEDGHKNNWNCYVREEKPGGEYIWDPMSAG